MLEKKNLFEKGFPVFPEIDGVKKNSPCPHCGRSGTKIKTRKNVNIFRCENFSKDFPSENRIWCNIFIFSYELNIKVVYISDPKNI